MAVYNQTVLTPDPLYLQPKSYDARSDRKWFSDIFSSGVVGSGDYAVTVPAVPSGLTLNVAAGIAYIQGGNIADQGMYREYISAGVTVTAPAAHATLPRIDTVIARIMDTAADASGFSEPRIEVVPGTATAGATLANLTGKNPLTALGEASKSFIVLAYILVPAAAGAFTNTATNVKDARTRTKVGGGNALGGSSITTSAFAAGPPASPNDGDIWIASAVDAAGTRWQFQYNASSGSSFKWEFIGGSNLDVRVNTTQACASGVLVDLATVGPSWTVARAGEYALSLGYLAVFPTASAGIAQAQTVKNGVGIADASANANGANIATFQNTPMTRVAAVQFALGDVVKLMYMISNGVSMTFQDRWLTIEPKRVS